MKLQRWLTSNDVSPSAFAARIGVTPRSVYRYLSGDTRPVPSIMVRIHAATNGKVTASDFYP